MSEPIILRGEGGVGFRIESLFAFLSVHADGDEGVIGTLNANGMWVPMIAADRARLDSMRPYVETVMVPAAKKPIILVQFTQRIDLETL